MYIFTFNLYFSFDKIVYLQTSTKLSIGDLIYIKWSYAIVLWDNISFKELYYKYNLSYETVEIIYKNFLNKNSIKLINYIVLEYFSTFRKVIPLFVPDNNIDKLLKNKLKIKSIKLNSLDIIDNKISISKEINKEKKIFIFPNVWSAYNIINNNKIIENYWIYYWSTSILSKSKLFWEISMNKKLDLLCTHSQIFQNWSNLKKIYIFNPHTWYYKTQQEPRYNICNIIEYMSKLYKNDLIYINDLRLF